MPSTRRTTFRSALLACVLSAGPVLAQTPPPANAPPVPASPVPSGQTVPPILVGPDGGSPAQSLEPFSRRVENPPAPAGPWNRAQIVVARTETPPVIDGKLTDPCWEKATRAVGFYRFGGSSPVAQQTEAWLAVDNHFLYVAFHCFDSEPGKIRASETQRGGAVDDDDHVAIEIDSQNTHRNFSTFYVSAGGVQKEELEGGAADNITFAGDWRAAARRVPDGWVAEVAIPFRLLRYPKGARAFGISLVRSLAREANPQVWPYLPPEGQTYSTKTQYLSEFTGFAPPNYPPRPVILPYVLATGGEGSSAREGMDIKYPLSSTLTLLAALRPDFKTVEQDVTDIAFSYTERFLPDRRPFFAEGADFFPSRDLFYSRRIGAFDEGFKIAGKSGGTTLGVVGTNVRSAVDGRTNAVFNLGQDVGPLSRVGFAAAVDNRNGQPSNRVGRMYTEWGKQQGRWRLSVNGSRMQSWQAEKPKGNTDDWNVRLRGGQGMPSFRASYNAVHPSFVSDLGFVPELNRRGFSASASQENSFDRGPIQYYVVDTDWAEYKRFDGSFFRRELSAFTYVQTPRGYSIEAGIASEPRRPDLGEPVNQDQSVEIGLGWNQRTLFQGGGVSLRTGKQDGESSRFVGIHQGFIIAKPFTLDAQHNIQYLGSDTTQQTVVTGTWRLSSTRTISGRLVRQDGSASGAGAASVIRGTNLYLAFAQRVRSGADVFLLLGDPNAPNTRGQITLKVLRPLLFN